MPGWEPLTDGLFAYADCCQVYALVDGERALLIDLGSGAALDQVADLGVREVAGVWFTHAHRDQCQGAAAAVRRGIPLRFPVLAREMVDPERRADFRKLSPCHLAYPCRFHPPQPLPTARFDLQPGAGEAWGPFDLQIIAAPGHLDHQVAFRCDGPGGSALFCGDAIHSRGKIHEAFCLETDHYTGAGARLAADTLCQLRNLRAERLCPSHGPVTSRGVWDAFDDTIDRLRAFADLKDTIVPRRPAARRLIRPRTNTFIPVSEHLWVWNNAYFLVSDDGPVLMVDVPTILPPSFHEAYRAALGDRPIEVVLVSHLHCDHVLGVEELRSHHPLQCWAQERLVEAIEAPYTYARPWLHNHPTRVDRPLADGETVTWHEYALTAWWFPGQTDLHDAFSTTVDGHRVLFSGDNFYPAQQWGGTGGQCGFNGSHPDLWRQSAELVLRLAPNWILASHLQPFEYRRADFEAVVDWTQRIHRAMRELAPDGNVERHHSPHFVEARPYVQPAAAENRVQLTLRNSYPAALELVVTPRLPAGVTGDAAPCSATVAPGASHAWEFSFHAAGLEGMRLVTFDVQANGEPWGELVECYLRGSGSYEGEA